MAKWLRRTETAEALIALIERSWGWLVLGGLGSGGLFAWLAAATEWLNAYGPITWGIAGAFGVIIFVSVLAIWARFALWVEQRRHVRIRIESPDPINPLDDTFQKCRIDISVFFDPFKELWKNKTFLDCDVIGPGVVIFLGNVHGENSSFKDCDFVLLNNKARVINGIGFENITFRRCRFYQLTILVPEQGKEEFEKIGPIPWISGPSSQD